MKSPAQIAHREGDICLGHPEQQQAIKSPQRQLCGCYKGFNWWGLAVTCVMVM